jgi:hypothetical protein
MATLTDDQIRSGAAQLRTLASSATVPATGTVNTLREMTQALEGMASALEARNADGLKAHAARLDGVAAWHGEQCGTAHRKIAARGLELSRLL